MSKCSRCGEYGGNSSCYVCRDDIPPDPDPDLERDWQISRDEAEAMKGGDDDPHRH